MNILSLFYRHNLKNNRLTFLNLGGLILGMFTFLFIYFYVYTEKNYDIFLPDAKELYHLEMEINKNGQSTLYSNTPIPMAEALFNEVAGIENYGTFCSVFETGILKINENTFLNPVVFYSNQSFPEIFHYKVLKGDMKKAIEPGKMVITRSAAQKYFGTINVIGKNLQLLHDKKEVLDETVEAVIEDIPYNSNIKFEILCSMDDYLHLIGNWVNSWHIKPAQSYIILRKGSDLSNIQQQVDKVIDKYLNNEKMQAQGITNVSLKNISEKHFLKNYTLQHPTERFVNKASLNILLGVGLITLIISWLNYFNFLIFQNAKHIKETGIRKISGSSKISLILLQLRESLLLTCIPVLITVLLFFWISPSLYKFFNFQSMKNIDINFRHFWYLTIILLFTGSVIAAIFPVIKLSGFKPIDLIQQKIKSSGKFEKKGSLILIVQLILSIFLICGILGINLQMKFLNNHDLGFTEENILVLSPPVTEDISAYHQKMDFFKKEALKIPGILALSAASSIPGEKLVTENFGLKNNEETINKFLGLSADENYFDVINARFLAGENFNKIPELRKNEIIINESMSHKLGFTKPSDALHQKTNMGDAQIIGVIKDYHHYSLHENEKPMLFRYKLDRLAYFMIRFNGEITNQQIGHIKNKWKEIFTNSPFEYSFLDLEYDQQYQEDKQLSKVVFVFSVISIIITILGLIGSCLNNTAMRTKEIGVRKVNGAKVSEVITLLSKEYLLLVTLAYLIATPLSWYIINKWIENFAYHTNLNLWLFASGGIIVLIIVMFTISLQSMNAALKNPLEALRYE